MQSRNSISNKRPISTKIYVTYDFQSLSQQNTKKYKFKSKGGIIKNTPSNVKVKKSYSGELVK